MDILLKKYIYDNKTNQIKLKTSSSSSSPRTKSLRPSQLINLELYGFKIIH